MYNGGQIYRHIFKNTENICSVLKGSPVAGKILCHTWVVPLTPQLTCSVQTWDSSPYCPLCSASGSSRGGYHSNYYTSVVPTLLRANHQYQNTTGKMREKETFKVCVSFKMSFVFPGKASHYL